MLIQNDSTSSVTCYLLTFNLAGKALLMKQLRAIVAGTSTDDRPAVIDIFAFAFQECPKKWSKRGRRDFRRTLNRSLGRCLRSYQIVKERSFGVLHLVVFARLELISLITDQEAFSKSLSKFSRRYRTKGAVAVAFRLNGHAILFFSCHFRFGGSSFHRRRRDYRRVIDSLTLPHFSPQSANDETKDTLAPFDCVFMAGDFNTRFVSARAVRQILRLRRRSSITDVSSSAISRMHKLDQLYLELQRSRRRSFENFYESFIRFPPSYKFIVDSLLYNWPRRMPAYTDRILYRKSASTSVHCHVYNAIRTVRTSDHRPVYGIFEVNFE